MDYGALSPALIRLLEKYKASNRGQSVGTALAPASNGVGVLGGVTSPSETTEEREYNANNLEANFQDAMAPKTPPQMMRIPLDGQKEGEPTNYIPDKDGAPLLFPTAFNKDSGFASSNQPITEHPSSGPMYQEDEPGMVKKSKEYHEITGNYLDNLLEQYRTGQKSFEELKAEAEGMASAEGYSPDVPNQKGWKGALMTALRGLAAVNEYGRGERYADGTAKNPINAILRYKRGMDDREAFDSHVDRKMKSDVLPQYQQERNNLKEQIGTVDQTYDREFKNYTTKQNDVYRREKMASVERTASERNAIATESLKYRVWSKESDLRQKEIDREFDAAKFNAVGEARNQAKAAFSAKVSEWGNQIGPLEERTKAADLKLKYYYKMLQNDSDSVSGEAIAAAQAEFSAASAALKAHIGTKPTAAQFTRGGTVNVDATKARATFNWSGASEKAKAMGPIELNRAVNDLAKRLDMSPDEVRIKLGLPKAASNFKSGK